ncbi:MAG: DUF3619 family protein [Deltaproteobacteria bacterium]|nr:DUF3619 family protein [Deltaproteobacteria bacterium]
MKEKDRENVFVGKVLSTLDKSTHDLDPETLSRLRIIRKEALETAKSSAWTSRWLGLGPFFRFPAAGIATAALILMATFLYLANPFGIGIHNGFEDSEILVITDNLEFYDELDFYSWLTEEARHNEKETHYRNGMKTQYVSSHSPQVFNLAPGEDEKPKERRLESRSYRVA